MTDQPQMPGPVAAVFDAMLPEAKARLLSVRALIFRVADEVEAGAVTETMKWGEPAYLTGASKSGTTIRLGVTAGRAAVFFNCQTTLVEGFRSDFPEAFEYDGSRALMLPEGFDEGALGLCLARALTYHRDKRRRKATA